MSVKTTRTWYIIGFTLGILGIVVGIFLICLQFHEEGYILKSAASDIYDIFAGYATLGVISIGVGALLIYNTYQILIPLRENSFTPSRVCQYCGAITMDNATVCEKCGHQIDSSFVQS